MFLPGSVMDKSDDSLQETDSVPGAFHLLKEIGLLDFGEEFRFKPLKLLKKFRRGAGDDNWTVVLDWKLHRFGYRKSQLALVFADLVVDPQQLLMVTVAMFLREIGYSNKGCCRWGGQKDAIVLFSSKDERSRGNIIRLVTLMIAWAVTMNDIDDYLEGTVMIFMVHMILAFSAYGVEELNSPC